ncbi:MAG: hypothetical protein ABJB74_04570 [Gemmatimonas sp.]
MQELALPTGGAGSTPNEVVIECVNDMPELALPTGGACSSYHDLRMRNVRASRALTARYAGMNDFFL